ncbi:hypothetical protein ES708_20475 [subsurface metagenome]
MDLKIERLVEERRMQGQTIKLLSGQREVVNPEIVPKGLVSINELNIELEEAQDFNEVWNAKAEGIKASEAMIEGIGEDIVELEQKIEDSKKEQDRHRGLIKGADKYIKENTPIQTGKIRNKIDSAEEENEIFRANERNKEAEKKCNQEIAVYEKQTAKINELRMSKNADLRKAKFPLPELKVTTAGTFFNDIPIKQLSSSENMKVAMSIAMALNEKFKVILVKEASLLDKENLKVIREMAKDGGYQVWLEMVSDTGEMGFYFVEGEITKVNGEEVKNG